jgi:hypothetical protein
VNDSVYKVCGCWSGSGKRFLSVGE